MTLQDVIHIGPLNLPVRYLVFILSVAFGYGTMSFILRHRPELKSATASRIINALVLYIFVWKLEPVAAELFQGLVVAGKLNWSSVYLQIFVPGGTLAAAIGGLAAVGYFVGSLLPSNSRNPRDSDSNEGNPSPGQRPILRSINQSLLALLFAVVPGLAVYLAASVILAAPVTGIRSVQAAARTHAAIGTSVGDLAPTFAADSLAGGRITMLSKPGKVVVLNFWATWCPPCRAELPDLVQFSAAQKSSTVEVWAVDMTGSEPSIKVVSKFAQSHDISFPVLLDTSGSLAASYKISAVPTTYIIAPDGIITAKQVGAMSPSWLRSNVRRATR